MDNKLANEANHTHNYSDEVVKKFMNYNDNIQEKWEEKKIEKLEEINALVEAKSLKPPQYSHLLWELTMAEYLFLLRLAWGLWWTIAVDSSPG